MRFRPAHQSMINRRFNDRASCPARKSPKQALVRKPRIHSPASGKGGHESGEKVVVRLALPGVCAGVSCHFPCGCALFRTGAAYRDVAAKATNPTIVGMITRISAAFLGGTVRRCAETVVNRGLNPR